MKLTCIFFAIVLVLTAALSPAYAENAFELGQHFSEIHFGEEARECFRRAAKEEPNNADVHIYIAHVIKDGYGPALRAIREYEQYLSVAPNGPFADEARENISGWNASVNKSGESFYSNLDCWFRDYYRMHAYHSWDKDPQPEWANRADEEAAGKPMYDVHFAGRSFQHPGGGSQFTAGPWTGPFLTQFIDRWQKTNVNGSAEVYLMVTKDNKLVPVITRLDGGNQFKEQLLKVIHSFNGSPLLSDAARSQCVFRAEIDRRFARKLEGTWSAFTYDGPPALYVAKLTGVFDKKVSGFVTTIQPAALGAHAQKLKANAKPVATPDAKSLERALSFAQGFIADSKVDQAADILWPLCEANDFQACYMLGHMYNSGTAKTAPWHRLAAPFMKKAADSGIADAQYEYGRMCDCDDGAEGWRADAITYYQKGAAKGNSNCCLALAIFYEFGDGVPKNLSKAAELYKKSAAHGDANAVEGLKRVQSVVHQT
jgi:hypothetical protein